MSRTSFLRNKIPIMVLKCVNVDSTSQCDNVWSTFDAADWVGPRPCSAACPPTGVTTRPPPTRRPPPPSTWGGPRPDRPGASPGWGQRGVSSPDCHSTILKTNSPATLRTGNFPRSGYNFTQSTVMVGVLRTSHTRRRAARRGCWMRRRTTTWASLSLPNTLTTQTEYKPLKSKRRHSDALTSQNIFYLHQQNIFFH